MAEEAKQPFRVATPEEFRRFRDLGYEDFRRLAADRSLTTNERIGFPDRYRAASEDGIFADLVAKLPGLNERGLQVLEIGRGVRTVAASPLGAVPQSWPSPHLGRLTRNARPAP